MANKCKPFFQQLKTTAKGKIVRTPKCEMAFNKLKSHLVLPLLTSSRLGENRFLYIATSEEVDNVVLISQREQEQVPIYNHSKWLEGAEVWYSLIKKIIYVVIHTCHHFRAYFLTHTIMVLATCSLCRMLHKLKLSGRMTK